MSTNKDNTSSFDKQVQDYTASELARDSQLERFLSNQKSVLVIGGYGQRLTVENKLLCWHIGETDENNKLVPHKKFEPRIHGLKTIIYVLSVGKICMQALKWIERENISLLVFDQHGQPLVLNAGGVKSDVDLLIRQACMPRDEKIAYYRFILKQKLQAQAETLRMHAASLNKKTEANRQSILQNLNELEDMSLEDMEQYERESAASYFGSWTNFPVLWSKSDAKVVNPTWLTFQHRHNGLGKSNARASHPMNAMLNVAYAVLACRIKIACIVCGLDTRISFWHAQVKDRDNLVYDLIEPLRASVDHILLDYLSKHKILKGDFNELEDLTGHSTGIVRMTPHAAKSWSAYVAFKMNDAYIHQIVDDYCNFLCSVGDVQEAA